MASSSSSYVHKSFTYDVFLSFRSLDTRKNFVDHLYLALQHKNIRTFKDDEEIKKGKKISDELIKSIENSKFYIIVFSKNYASSSSCLDELVKIMECHRTTHDHTVYPIFYDVEPFEVYEQTGAVGEAFANLEKKTRAGLWREALTEAAELAGWELKNTCDGHEAKFIQKVVDDISIYLCNSSIVDTPMTTIKEMESGVMSSLLRDAFDIELTQTLQEIGNVPTTFIAMTIFILQQVQQQVQHQIQQQQQMIEQIQKMQEDFQRQLEQRWREFQGRDRSD